MTASAPIPLRELGALRVSGADAEAFLQGQLSNDLRRLTTASAQLSSLNSPKGRMLAVLHLWREGDAIWLEVHRSVLEAVARRLRMFVLRSKVTIDEPGAGLRAVGFAGPGAPARLASLGLTPPEAPLALAADRRGLTLIRRHGGEPRWTLHGPAAILEALAPGEPGPADALAWRLQDIESGIATVYPATSDHFVPQMCNLDLAGGIAFDKGCYTGQEIVARLHYLGTLKRRMYLCAAPVAPLPGTSVVEAGAEPGAEDTPAGEVVDAVAAPEGARVAIVLQTSFAESRRLHLGSAAGPALGLPRPYAYDG